MRWRFCETAAEPAGLGRAADTAMAPSPRILSCGVVTALNRQWEFRGALCVVATALGTDFATGRTLSTFYAQLGEASWLGVAFAGLAFGFFTTMISHLARRAGADSVPALLRRMPGGPMGRGVGALYALIAFLAVCALTAAAGHAGALTLPMRNAGFWSGATALLAALSVALAGRRAMALAGGTFLGFMGLFELGLLFFSRPPGEALLRFELELRLRNHLGAALGLALLHASVCACVCAGATARLAEGRVRPLRLGMWSGGLFFLLLAGGNAVLAAQSEQLLALRLPFVALASGWGTAGFYLSALLSYLAAVVSLAGVAYGLIPRKMMLNYENSTLQD